MDSYSEYIRQQSGIRKRRFVQKDGTPNVVRRGEGRLKSFDIYHFLLHIPMWQFGVLILAYYTTINFLFALFYYFFSLPHLAGIITGDAFQNFEEAFFFSSQTLTTVGYGRISPVGLLTNTVAAFEALIGILTLAIITGTLYGRFVRPKAYIRFSHLAMVGTVEGSPALSFRLVASKKTKIHELKIRVSVSLRKENGEAGYDFFPIQLQEDSFNALYLCWLVVHPLTPDSPLYGLNEADYTRREAELLVHLNAFDEQFNSNVIARTSYVSSEMIHQAAFVPMFQNGETTTVLYLNKLDQFERE